MATEAESIDARVRRLTRTARIAGVELHYCPGRLIPDTVLTLKSALREVERLWRDELGDRVWNDLSATAEGRRFFGAVARVEPVPPVREMVVVRLPLPSGFRRSVKPQLIDALEPDEPGELD